MSYVSGTLAAPHVFFTESTDRGATWAAPRAIETAGDRGFYTAPAISPNGTDVYVVYNAFTTPFQPTTATPRALVGVVKHADDRRHARRPGRSRTLNRGAPGDPRASSANALTDEFLGDYVYAAATRTYGAAVWNDSPQRRGLPGDRRLAPGAAERPEPARAGTTAALPGDVRQLGHLRRHLRRPDAVARTRPGGGLTTAPRAGTCRAGGCLRPTVPFEPDRSATRAVRPSCF